jgi:hypothetical protein
MHRPQDVTKRGQVSYIDFVMLLNSLLPHHDSKSNGLKSETNINEFDLPS